MATALTVAGLVMSAFGAVVIAGFDPNPGSIVAQLSPENPEYSGLEPASWAGRFWNSMVRGEPSFEDDDSRWALTAETERLIRLRGGWGSFILGALLQVAGELL